MILLKLNLLTKNIINICIKLSLLGWETHLKVELPHMLSGQVQGKFLSMVSHMIQPRRILELGTYTGYSAICLAAGLTTDGILHTIDINEELETLCREYFEASGYADKIKIKPRSPGGLSQPDPRGPTTFVDY